MFCFGLHLLRLLLLLFCDLQVLSIRESDLVAHKAQVLGQHSIEVGYLLSREHGQLEHDEKKIQDA